jgi:hypothetical protein
MNSDGFMFDHVVVVLGENGEKIYITDHSDCEGREFGIGDCTALTIDAEGYIRADGCKWNDEALLSRLKPPAASQR